jgi:hypothetical protein
LKKIFGVGIVGSPVTTFETLVAYPNAVEGKEKKVDRASVVTKAK